MKVFTTILASLIFSVPLLSQVREPWAAQPPATWPVIALTNNVTYKNGDQYIHSSFAYAGTGFLVNTGRDTVAVTAKHVLLIARNKKTNAVSINKDLQRWTLRARGSSYDAVEVDKLINEDTSEIIEGANSSIFERDMLVLSLKKISPNIQPLRPRYSSPRVGERVYIIGCAYADNTCLPVEGTVANKYGLDILISTDKPIQPGASGAAVVDANGWLIGVFSSITTDSKTGRNLAVAISTEYLRDVLTHKANLNQPKKDYGEMILNIALNAGAKEAIDEYRKLTAYPHMYYFYNFRSTTRNGLREAGEKLLEMNRIEDAIEILKFNTQVNSGLYSNFNILGRAYMMAGNREEAINAYKISVNKFNNRSENEAVRQLEIIQSGR
ncbi:MAG: trypsin-like peptidase domain-containing protein [Chitinophagaceae bacterium]|nr:trypsin-like peptidase domain-containing protein [Chitinophagaceae bacterium]